MVSKKISPKGAFYSGYAFASTVEARWALFLDRLGIAYEYEYEGFNLGGGYRPDFWLPDLRMWAEVKGDHKHNYVGNHVDKCQGLADGLGYPVLLLTGTPNYRLYSKFNPQSRIDVRLGRGPFVEMVHFQDREPHVTIGFPFWIEAEDYRNESETGSCFLTSARAKRVLGEGVKRAILASRFARFEW